MSRQVGHQHRKPVMGKEARLQAPIGVVVARTVEEHQHRLVRRDILTARVGIDAAVVDEKFHDRRALFLRGAERLAQVGDDIARILQPHGQTHHLLAHARRLEVVRPHLLMGRAGRMDHQ